MASSMKVSVDINSPALDGRSTKIMRDFADELEQEVAQFARDRLLTELDLVLKHPTGYYESQIRLHQESTLQVVDDSGVVYGPWLAGTSDRNRETRFKGYLHWRKTQQAADDEAERKGEQLFTRRYERRLES